jgi:hypothetical protein
VRQNPSYGKNDYNFYIEYCRPVEMR